MGFGFRKSFKVAPGVRLNVGKKGMGVSVGGRGARVSASSRGVRVGTSIPGTGISYSQQLSNRKKRPQRVAYESLSGVHSDAKQQSINENSRLVDAYQAQVNMLTSVHLESEEPIDWVALQQEPTSFPEGMGPAEKSLQDAILTFKPTWRDRLFNRTSARKQELERGLASAQEQDTLLLTDVESKKQLAARILSGEPNAWIEAMDLYHPFNDIELFGSRITFKINDNGQLIATLLVGNENTVPKEVISLTKTGKVSTKAMAKTRYLQLYQDYVCSCVIRIARECFAIVPISDIRINVFDYSQADEPPVKGCILSTRIRREELSRIDFETIDCSDTIETFEHHMKHLKTKGFRLVEEVYV